MHSCQQELNHCCRAFTDPNLPKFDCLARRAVGGSGLRKRPPCTALQCSCLRSASRHAQCSYLLSVSLTPGCAACF